MPFVLGVALGSGLDIVLPATAWGVGFLLFPLASSAQLPEVFLAALMSAFLLPGVAQLVWNGPVALVLWRRGRRSMALGVLTAMAIVFLLNAACWGLLGAAIVGRAGMK